MDLLKNLWMGMGNWPVLIQYLLWEKGERIEYVRRPVLLIMYAD